VKNDLAGQACSRFTRNPAKRMSWEVRGYFMEAPQHPSKREQRIVGPHSLGPVCPVHLSLDPTEDLATFGIDAEVTRRAVCSGMLDVSKYCPDAARPTMGWPARRISDSQHLFQGHGDTLAATRF
jgi:hypothetical protein